MGRALQRLGELADAGVNGFGRLASAVVWDSIWSIAHDGVFGFLVERIHIWVILVVRVTGGVVVRDQGSFVWQQNRQYVE